MKKVAARTSGVTETLHSILAIAISILNVVFEQDVHMNGKPVLHVFRSWSL